MARKFFSPHHVESLALLPKTLTPGVAYFVDDEHQIVIDFGDGLGAHTYGGTSGYISASPSAVNGFLQDQLNTLAGGVLLLAVNFWQETQTIRKKLEHLAGLLDDESLNLQGQTDKTAEGILQLCLALYEHTGKADAEISSLQEQIADLPEFPDTPPAPPLLPPKQDRILAYYLMPEDTITVDGYTWTVTEITRSDDGRITLTLDLIEGES